MGPRRSKMADGGSQLSVTLALNFSTTEELSWAEEGMIDRRRERCSSPPSRGGMVCKTSHD